MASLSTANPLLTLPLNGANTVETASRPDRDAANAGVAVLTRRLAAAEEEAFREFHALYFDRLYQFLLVVSRGREDEAREALQETLLRVARYARVFDHEEAFWCWLKVVARSAARDAGRKQRRYFAMLQNFARQWSSHADPRETEEEDRARALLEESLAELTPEDRRLIEGKYLEGRSVKELADAAGLTDKAVESRLLRARRSIRDFILQQLRHS